MKLRLLAALACFLLPGLSYLNADVFRWVDRDGTVVFGNRPPADARDVRRMFEEAAPAPAPPGAAEPGDAGVEAVLQELEAEKAREEAERRQAEAVRRQAPPTREELIAREREKLEKRIAELEEQPLEYFGSQKNKRVRIGYYRYRLDKLLADPEGYFANPEPFEGNVKTPAQE